MLLVFDPAILEIVRKAAEPAVSHCVENILLHNGGTAERRRTSAMAIFNKFGIIPVARSLDGKLLVQKEVAFPSEEEAKRAGKIFADVLGGAVAFRRINDPDTGIVGQGVIIGKYGVMAEKSAPQSR
jgi:hypothetical protein